MFDDKIEFECVNSVIGSGYEAKVADLALRDKVAYRAARSNMQIHSAIILKINSEFSGFFTFEVNHKVGEFCLLQSAMELDRKNKEIYGDFHGFKYNEKVAIKTSETKKRDNEIDRINGTK